MGMYNGVTGPNSMIEPYQQVLLGLEKEIQ